jgi:hypothetical protein
MEYRFEVHREGRRRWRTHIVWGTRSGLMLDEKAHFPCFSEEAAIRKGMRWVAKRQLQRQRDWKQSKKRYDAQGLEIPKEEWEK